MQEHCEVPFLSQWNALDAKGWPNDFDASVAGEVRSLGVLLDPVQNLPFYPKSQSRYLKSRLHPFYSRHGAHTTMAQQLERSLTGLTPDGEQGAPKHGVDTIDTGR